MEMATRCVRPGVSDVDGHCRLTADLRETVALEQFPDNASVDPRRQLVLFFLYFSAGITLGLKTTPKTAVEPAVALIVGPNHHGHCRDDNEKQEYATPATDENRS